MPRLIAAGLLALVASVLPISVNATAQIVRSSPATAGSAQFDPFGNPAANPYLNPWMAATAQPTDPSTTLLYMMGARRYVQGQQEAIRARQQQATMSESAIRRARGLATPGRLDAATSRYRFDSIRSRRGQSPNDPTDSRYGQTGSYYYR